ncbi:MAG: peptidyl-prolyl cis-trans isomerase [Solobacterium sp.]|nr:peptidyl-prolyl cis-trans isomerase [Solobacterium sp.]
MKKQFTAAIAGMMLVTLAGCTDASAKLKDADTVLFTVGNTTVTKGTVYSMMKSSDTAGVITTSASHYIADQEIEVTDEMRTSAEETLASYKEIYGDSFTSYLESSGMTEEDYINEYLLAYEKEDKLTEKYIEENYDKLIEEYKPLKATILTFKSEDDANAALSELKDGKADASEAAKNHNSDSTGSSSIYTLESTELDAMVRTVLFSLGADDGWQNIISSDGSEFYLVHADETDTETLHDDIVSYFSSNSDFAKKIKTFYLNKYNFRLYDIDAYNAVKESYPEYVVQDGTASE